jgi:hypothetical protein
MRSNSSRDDRTSCREPKANQFRLILHTAAYRHPCHAQCRAQALAVQNFGVCNLATAAEIQALFRGR